MTNHAETVREATDTLQIFIYQQHAGWHDLGFPQSECDQCAPLLAALSAFERENARLRGALERIVIRPGQLSPEPLILSDIASAALTTPDQETPKSG